MPSMIEQNAPRGLLWGAAVLGVVGFLAGHASSDRESAAAPPLSLEGYLDEKLPEASGNAERLPVDNGACYVCHKNYDGEGLALVHGKAEIACVDCHGQSDAHRNDEDNITPPDRMFALGDVDGMCAECHEGHDAPAREVLARWRERCPTKTDPAEIVCTDCHFQHRLPFRTVWWDRDTGKLVIRKGDQRIKRAEDLTKTPTEKEE
jgi:predicted CXXCH cytochrome family protein